MTRLQEADAVLHPTIATASQPLVPEDDHDTVTPSMFGDMFDDEPHATPHPIFALQRPATQRRKRRRSVISPAKVEAAAGSDEDEVPGAQPAVPFGSSSSASSDSDDDTRSSSSRDGGGRSMTDKSSDADGSTDVELSDIDDVLLGADDAFQRLSCGGERPSLMHRLRRKNKKKKKERICKGVCCCNSLCALLRAVFKKKQRKPKRKTAAAASEMTPEVHALQRALLHGVVCWCGRLRNC